MNAPTWRSALALTTAAALATTLTGAVTLATPRTADAATCRATPTLLSRTPTVTKLAGGATARIWDTGPTPSNPQASTRIVAVTVPSSSTANPRVRGASSLNSSRIPSAYFLDAPTAVVMVNGGVFNATVGAMPDLPQMTSGWLRKARSTHDPAIVTAKDGRSLPSRLWITGSVSASGHGYQAVTGLNWQSLAGSGINAYTPSWGKARRPYGTADVVVAGGKVVAVRTGTTRGQAAASGQTILTATGTAGSWLASFRIGTSVSVGYHASTDAPFPAYEAVGRGARFLNQGVKNGGTCTSRDELLRPRTAVGWTNSGDLLVVAVSGRATVDGVRYGGATIHQMADYMAKLGSWDATNLDGGGSTTMVARTASGKVIRLDRAGTEWQRSVPNVFSAG
ncbi:phosphodiester glycosidase family protein [Pedococcus bigeumensis]|uniref:phosphodiester glycosidase family protein n=1 Tax=Pedococcus bigeumensis TaxID=433644 RepID=UPI002FE77AB1